VTSPALIINMSILLSFNQVSNRCLVLVEIIFPAIGIELFFHVEQEFHPVHASGAGDIEEFGSCQPGISAVLTGDFCSSGVFSHSIIHRQVFFHNEGR